MHHVYLRVSTDHQEAENQKTGLIAWLVAHGNPPLMLHTDTASGATGWRDRKLAGLLADCAPGDSIVVAEVSRIGRSTVDVLDFVKHALDRDVSVIITKSNMILDHSIQSKITTTMLALASEIERHFLLARTAEGLARAKANGVRLGRPPGAKSASKLASKAAEVDKLIKAKIGDAAIGRIFGVSRGTVARYRASVRSTEGEPNP